MSDASPVTALAVNLSTVRSSRFAVTKLVTVQPSGFTVTDHAHRLRFPQPGARRPRDPAAKAAWSTLRFGRR